MKPVFYVLMCLFLASCCMADREIEAVIGRAVEDGKIAYKLTTPEELAGIAGLPVGQSEKKDGGTTALTVTYPSGVVARFTRMHEIRTPGPFTLVYLKVNNKQVQLEKRIILRDPNDLAKIDNFWGLAGVSLVRVDLRDQKNKLDQLPFDTRTLWPGRDRLPEGFDPAKLIEEGINPGLGIRGLQAEGIDGTGIGIAILDQPLLKDHVEYKSQLADYQVIGLKTFLASPQMHGPPVCSIAAGTRCGVAPKASLYYFSYPSWEWGFEDCKPYCRAVERILETNQTLPAGQKIRVISNSFGGFSQMPNYNQWKEVVRRANESGVLVVTCDPDFLKICTLTHKDGQEWDRPGSFERGLYGRNGFDLAVPAGNRTIASHHGTQVYMFDRAGGMSWTVPWLAGLAAMAFQIDPNISPEQIILLWKETAWQTDLGPVVNPRAFINAVKERERP